MLSEHQYPLLTAPIVLSKIDGIRSRFSESSSRYTFCATMFSLEVFGVDIFVKDVFNVDYAFRVGDDLRSVGYS